MSCRVICRECMNCITLDTQCQLVNVSLKHLKQSDRCSSYICPRSVWTSEQSKWSSMSRIVLCRASKPLKSVALSDSTNVSIGWISSSVGDFSPIHIISRTLWLVPSLTSYSRLLGAFILLNFAMILHRWASVKRAASSFIRFMLRFIQWKDLESDMSKVCTYQLSAHQLLWFKVRTWAGDY